jgi:Zn finger protein HypA/HybF involved in hydrogenase expression
MKVRKHVAHGDGYGECGHCGSRFVYETPRRCRCPNCDTAYCPGHDNNATFDMKLVVAIEK